MLMYLECQSSPRILRIWKWRNLVSTDEYDVMFYDYVRLVRNLLEYQTLNKIHAYVHVSFTRQVCLTDVNHTKKKYYYY